VELKTNVIPVITGTTGTISEPLIKHLSNITGKHEIKKLHRSHIGHCKHTSESTDVKAQKDLTLEIALYAA
jgi:hypothetical protein